MKILKGPSDEDTRQAFQHLNAPQILDSIYKHGLKKDFLDLAFEKLLLLSSQEVLDLAVNYRLGDEGMDIAIQKGILKKISVERLLTKAVQANSLKYVRYALDHGARCLPIPGSGYTALMYAAGSNFIEIIKTILQFDIDINTTDRVGWTALHHAVYHNRLEAANLLIIAGARPNIQNENGKTLLMYAVIRNNFACVKLLYDNPTDLLVRDNNHKMAYDYCRNHSIIERFLSDKINLFRNKNKISSI